MIMSNVLRFDEAGISRGDKVGDESSSASAEAPVEERETESSLQKLENLQKSAVRRGELADDAALELYRRAKLDPAKVCGAPRVATGLLGRSCIELVTRPPVRAAGILGWCKAWVITVASGLSACRLNHAVAHELAEWWLGEQKYTGLDREELAASIGARICAPAAAMKLALRDSGEDIARLSRSFVVSLPGANHSEPAPTWTGYRGADRSRGRARCYPRCGQPRDTGIRGCRHS